MAIQSTKEKALRENLIDITKGLIKELKFINKKIKDKDIEKLSKVFLMHDELVMLTHNSFEKSIDNFSYAPLGIDLRRNIAYLMSSRSLKNISINILNITKFMIKNSKYRLSYDWTSKLNDKLISELKVVIKILETESPEIANKQITKDIEIASEYKKLMTSIGKKINPSNSKLTTNEKDQLREATIDVVKSFETALDSINKIAEISLFISTGKLLI